MLAYRSMAQAVPDIVSSAPAPKSYRILPTYLAGLLPFSINFSFWFLSIVFSFFLIIAFSHLLQKFTISHFGVFFTLSLFMFNRYTFGVYVYNYFQLVDLFSLLWLILAFFALYHRNWWLLVSVSLLGILTKEVILLLVPTLFYYFWAKDDEWKTKSVFIVLFIFIFLGWISFISPGDKGHYLWERLMNNLPKLYSWKHWGELFINTFTPLSFLPLIFFETSKKFLRDHSYFIVFTVFCAISTLFAGTAERLMIPVAIPFYLLMAKILQEWSYPGDWKLWSIFVLAFVCLFHHEMGVVNLPSRKMTIILYISSLVITTFIGFWMRTKHKLQQAKIAN